MSCLYAQPRERPSDLTLANIEALAENETVTTYNCVGKGDCPGFTCGVCMTTIPAGKGNLTGGHKCW
ncbi:NVEALA domain-containing protein [uncultured Rikenella sp.]|uniref:NVEALA domain-containing protein n=1 Tax=uncultured Rikenella sp. TaxID=368003 RepID=UPI002620A059|nr:NVEALA domain-containing protein [uncultured Rikenella sp.]